MHYFFFPIVSVLLSGGYWVETEWFYNLHPAATLGLCFLTFLMMPYTVQRTHDRRLYEMFIIVARESELRFKKLLEKLEIEDPVDDD